MKKLLAAGPLREIITTFFGCLAAWGLVNEQLAPTLAGFAIALAMVAQGCVANVGRQQIWTLVRKVFSLTPGLLIALEWVTPDQAAAIGSLLLPVASVIWSAYGKGDPEAASKPTSFGT